MKLLSIVCAVVVLASLSVSAADWRPLFNGRDLSGWYVMVRGETNRNYDPAKIVQVDNGTIHMYKDCQDQSRQPMVSLTTSNEFANYHLRLEYKWGTKKFAPRQDKPRDAGLLYHVFGPDVVWPTSVEYQIQEGDTGKIYTVRTKVETTIDPNKKQPRYVPAADGGVRTLIGSTEKPVGINASLENERDGWNTVEVIVKDDTAIHILNGKTNNVVLSMIGLVNGEWKPMKKGKILLQAEASEVYYRNVEIRSLDDK